MLMEFWNLQPSLGASHLASGPGEHGDSQDSYGKTMATHGRSHKTRRWQGLTDGRNGCRCEAYRGIWRCRSQELAVRSTATREGLADDDSVGYRRYWLSRLIRRQAIYSSGTYLGVLCVVELLRS